MFEVVLILLVVAMMSLLAQVDPAALPV